ncbi:MAG TPA: trypsin-like serine protease [Bacteroidales bacterium]|nr:trypsin-like serine protease [Bacteroidales bacterium]
MKKILLVIPFLLHSFILLPQKVTINVVRDQPIEWQILDESYDLVFAGSNLTENDSVSFTLESERRYFLQVSFNTFLEEVNLLRLYVAEEPVVLVNSGIGAGDHFLPFVTGVRQQVTKITGGTDALISDYPWQVYIIAGSKACGGSIISDRWILTAAHCVYGNRGFLSPDSVRVKANANNPYDPYEGETHQADQVKAHEQYDPKTNKNDIALIRLQTPIVNSSPIKIVTREDASFGATDPGVMTWVTGWGLTSVNPDRYPSNLKKVQLPIISLEQASVVWKSIPSTVLMAGYRNGNRDACNGDSGGPMVVNVLGDYKLAGVVSWGSSNCNTYGAYTNVSLFEEWIYSNTGIEPFLTPMEISGDTLVCKGTDSSNYTVGSTPGIETFEWVLQPQSAGLISSTQERATISWNDEFSGNAYIAYRFEINNEFSEWSRIRINVVDATKLVSISNDQEECENSRITISVVAEGHNLVYNWYKDESAFRTSTQPNIVIFPAKPANSGIYTVEVKGSCGIVKSDPVSLTINPLTKIISVSPDIIVPFGENYNLEVNALGHNLEYLWQKDTLLLEGEIGSSLVLTNVNATDIGNYRVTVSGTCGILTSDDIYVFVKNITQPWGKEIYVWPTLINDRFNVAVSNVDPYDVLIYNTSGKLIALYKNQLNQNSIEASGWAKGMYIVTIVTKNFRKSIRVIKY